ncbi:biotin--[acetyl-CoA-carboxylase] ligase [Chondromyces apiculatus]|uniref:biotin--[biotin carboxyl-carrier protein] ligase n=1 Tax=Chondromyces apiculatus DSM 436 TaxID=1192034 RepID=A0A017SVF0_9BACT|nr:biotin--[acetyl-CoA-carboxylase] ligase [Chondromyces apiculatus]EYF00286.1 biotin--acetyl-CoA-carboxylase ligase [Chondromyces apiculatus DSM 436]
MSGLDEAALHRALGARGATLGLPLSVMAQTGSTNDDARRAAQAGAPQGATFVADEQISGRGRGGHRWYSPAGENLYLSVVLRPRLPPAAAARITLVCGLVVAAVVEGALAAAGRAGCAGCAELAVGLKWPNDVLVEGKKVAGVLVEGQSRGEMLHSLVVGVGLNVRARELPEEIAHRATSLAMLGVQASREELAAELLARLGEAVSRFEAEGLVAFGAEIGRRDWLQGREIEVGEVAGVASGIDAEGRLLVRSAEGTLQAVAAGEVSVRYR